MDELITPGAVSAELKAAAHARREARAALGPDFAFEATVEEDCGDDTAVRPSKPWLAIAPCIVGSIGQHLLPFISLPAFVSLCFCTSSPGAGTVYLDRCPTSSRF